MRKEHKTSRLFIAVDHKTRLVKFSAVTNITAFRFMMKDRYPSYEIINDDNPYIMTDNILFKLMDKMEKYRYRQGNQFRTYHLDNYRIQTIIRLLTESNSKIVGIDQLTCLRCKDTFEGDYSNIKDIRQFISIDIRYCSDDCTSKTEVTKTWHASQRYCKCGDIFNPTHKLDFYCPKCS